MASSPGTSVASDPGLIERFLRVARRSDPAPEEDMHAIVFVLLWLETDPATGIPVREEAYRVSLTDVSKVDPDLAARLDRENSPRSGLSYLSPSDSRSDSAAGYFSYETSLSRDPKRIVGSGSHIISRLLACLRGTSPEGAKLGDETIEIAFTRLDGSKSGPQRRRLDDIKEIDVQLYLYILSHYY